MGAKSSVVLGAETEKCFVFPRFLNAVSCILDNDSLRIISSKNTAVG
jgi:hypothetical protein